MGRRWKGIFMDRALVAFVQKKAMDHTNDIDLSSSLPQNNKTEEIFAILGCTYDWGGH